MSGGSSQSTQQLDPALRDAFLENVTRATGVAEGLQARQFAGFTPEQNRAMQNISNFADPNSEGFNALRGAYGTLQTAAGYNPNQVVAGDYNAAQANAANLARSDIRDVQNQAVTGSAVAREALGAIAPEARANIRDVNAGSFLNQNIQAYMNPYTQAVTNQSLSDLERSRQLQQQQNAAQATARNAFGGSRQGVVEAETNRAFDENAARLVAQQNAAGFEAAQRASEADLARQMQAQQLNQAQDLATTQQSLQLAGQFGLANQDAALRAALANQGVDLSVGSLNAQNQQQANLANQAATNASAIQRVQNAMQASLANQEAGLTANQQRIGAANQMTNTGTAFTSSGIAANQALADQGLLRQGFSQQQLDAIRNLPLEQQQIINQALGINPAGGSGMQQQSSSRQGLLGVLGL
jgi:hypothetical protein